MTQDYVLQGSPHTILVQQFSTEDDFAPRRLAMSGALSFHNWGREALLALAGISGECCSTSYNAWDGYWFSGNPMERLPGDKKAYAKALRQEHDMSRRIT